MDVRKIGKGLALNFFRTVGLFFVFIAILQFQDHFVGYALVSLGIAALILYVTFRGVFRNRKPH